MRRYHVLLKRNHETVMAMALYANSPQDAAMLAEHFQNTKYDEVLVRNYFKTESEDLTWMH